jgi:protein-S-isoprenylcysteine O-methyltransferase Ste14
VYRRSSRRLSAYCTMATGIIICHLSPGQGLVTQGLYSRIRNPIYVFSALLLLGVLIALEYRYALLFLLILVPVQIVRARQEGKVLEARFGDEYRRYREGTWF